MSKFKLDVFGLLSKIDNPNSGDIYKSLSEDEKKGFAPLVVQRWLSGTSASQQIMLLNEFTNPVIFALGKHPHLLMQLFQACSSKTAKRYYWLSTTPKKKKNEETKKVIMQYYELSSREYSAITVLPKPEELLEMANKLGWQNEEINKLKKEINSES